MVDGEQDVDILNFDNIENINFMKFKTQLKPVISKTDKFDLEQAKLKVINYLKELITLIPQEKSFINEFRNKNYKPELLFDDKGMVENTSHHLMTLRRYKK